MRAQYTKRGKRIPRDGTVTRPWETKPSNWRPPWKNSRDFWSDRPQGRVNPDSVNEHADFDAERGAETPWSTEFAPTVEVRQTPGYTPTEADKKKEDETWVFWAEQERPTTLVGGAPRRRPALPLPDPLPELAKPSEAPTEAEELDAAYGRKPKPKERTPSFNQVYGQVEPTVTDVDGEKMEIDRCSTFAEAVEQWSWSPALRAALGKRNFWQLTPVQAYTIPLMTSRTDFLATAYTGSGKTAGYLLPMVDALLKAERLVPDAMVLAHFKTKDGSKSRTPSLAHVKGMKAFTVGLEFQHGTGNTHRQFVPVQWVVQSPEPPPPLTWQGPARPKALILVPTRELAEQVSADCQSFLEFSSLRCQGLHATNKYLSQWRSLAHGADVVAATPGALIDALHHGLLKLDRVQHFVLDEVDRMMELDFGKQLEEICDAGGLPTSSQGRHTTFWSATIPYAVRDVVEAFLGKRCAWVDAVGSTASPMASTITHKFVDARPFFRTLRKFEPGDKVICKGGKKGFYEFCVGTNRHKIMFMDGETVTHKFFPANSINMASPTTKLAKEDKLLSLRDCLWRPAFRDAKVLLFCRRRSTASEVFNFLVKAFRRTVLCHGGMTQNMRGIALQQFRDNTAEILVATDIAARGLDISDITHVVNYELPTVIDEWVHRCGRVGRIGKEGTAVTFIDGREMIFKQLVQTVHRHKIKLPDWFSREGLRLDWKHRGTQLPFQSASDLDRELSGNMNRVMEKGRRMRNRRLLARLNYTREQAWSMSNHEDDEEYQEKRRQILEAKAELTRRIEPRGWTAEDGEPSSLGEAKDRQEELDALAWRRFQEQTSVAGTP